MAATTKSAAKQKHIHKNYCDQALIPPSMQWVAVDKTGELCQTTNNILRLIESEEKKKWKINLALQEENGKQLRVVFIVAINETKLI